MNVKYCFTKFFILNSSENSSKPSFKCKITVVPTSFLSPFSITYSFLPSERQINDSSFSFFVLISTVLETKNEL